MNKTRLGFYHLALSCLVACSGVLFTASHSCATNSERLYAGPLAQLHLGQNQQALDGFRSATINAPNDPLLPYFEGLALGQLGRWKESAEAQRRALSLLSDFPAAQMELGRALIELGRYDEAISLLEAAMPGVLKPQECRLLMGLAYLRSDRHQDADQYFAIAADNDPSLAASATFYRGVSRYRQGDHSGAAAYFQTVVDMAPNTNAAQESSQYLARLGSRDEQRLRLHARTGIEYDSNLTLAPSDAGTRIGLGVSENDDFRSVIEAGADYLVRAHGNTRLTASYNLFQSLHFQFDENNIQSHRVGTHLVTETDKFSYGTSLSYEYLLADSDSFSGELKLRPWVSVPQGERGVAEFYYQYSLEDYDEFQNDSIDFLDAQIHSLGTRQVFFFGDKKRFVGIGARVDRREADNDAGDQFAYYAGRADLGGAWRIDEETQLAGTFTYEHRDYDSASDNREDDRLIPQLSMYRRIAERVWLVARYEMTFNNSNKDAEGFEYDRNLAAINIEVR